MMWPFYLAVWFFSAIGLYCIARWYIVHDQDSYTRADRLWNIIISTVIPVWLLLAFIVFCNKYDWKKDAKW